MYPFEADMVELQNRYGSPDHLMMSAVAGRIKDAITGTPYKHRSDEIREALLYMAAAMLLGKIKKPKLAATFVEHDMLIYANEACATKSDSMIELADRRYGLGIAVPDSVPDDMYEPVWSISLQGYLRSIPKDGIWDLSNRHMSHGIIQISFKELNRLASNIIGKELTKNFQRASYNDEIENDAVEIITDALAKNNPNIPNSTAMPPCMLYCQRTLADGEHVPYNGRFALAAFHGKRGMPPDKIAVLFENAPDYKEGVTNMHIGNILDKKLMPYSCDKMEQYGLCKKHERCGAIKNPLSYR